MSACAKTMMKHPTKFRYNFTRNHLYLESVFCNSDSCTRPLQISSRVDWDPIQDLDNCSKKEAVGIIFCERIHRHVTSKEVRCSL